MTIEKDLIPDPPGMGYIGVPLDELKRLRGIESEATRLLKWLKSASGEEPRPGESFADFAIRLF